MTYQNLNLEGIMTETNNKRTQHIDVCLSLIHILLVLEQLGCQLGFILDVRK